MLSVVSYVQIFFPQISNSSSAEQIPYKSQKLVGILFPKLKFSSLWVYQ